MVSNNLVVPVVLWGPTAPTHCISSVFLSEDQCTLVTGCYDGQICLWQVEPTTLKMSPRCLLVGHSAPVLCLVRASLLPENNFLVSSSENGEMCTWDLIDGKCTEAVKLPQVHTQIQSYHTANSEDLRLFCIGYYAEIMVMDPFSLEVIYVLSSKVKPDWISAIHVLRPMRRKDDVVLAITTTGTVKVWTLTGNENKHAEPIYENESKEIRCLNAITMNCCSQNQRTVLLVCTKYWQIYDAGDFTVLCSVIAPARERWQGGDFITSDRVMLWTDEGKGYLYKLPANCIPDNKEFHSKSVVRDAPYLYYVLQHAGDKVLSCPPAMKLLTGQQTHFLLRGDSEGYISAWNVPEVPLDNISILQAKQMPPRIQKPHVCTSLVEAWSIMDPPPVGILDQLSRITESPVKLTSSIYLPQQSRLVIGREDGSIVIVPATQTVMMQLLVGIKQNFSDWPSHQILYGHRGRVNCLLCPSMVHPRYEKSHLLSGGIDFAVCLWDLYSGSLLHRFCVHAGEITQLLVPPESCSPRILKCICSVASDHSVTLVSLQERKCVTLASRHLFPVVTIKWRPLDDFLIVGCSDGSVYVWQMETGHLDRVLHGMLAEEVLSACDEQALEEGGGGGGGSSGGTSNSASEMGMANPAVHFFRGLKSRNMNAIRHATQRGIHQLQQLQGHNQGNFDFLMKHRSNPLVIQGLRTNPKDAESHILFFDIEGLIFELHSEEYAQMTPATLEALGVHLNNPKDNKSMHIDASKKINDFFIKVKSKAVDVEKILKDKDKHGLVQKFKEKTEIVEKKVQAKVESLQKAVEMHEDQPQDLKSKIASKMEVTHVMEVAQLLLSLLHSWGLDPHLDKVCESQLGLLRPIVPISYGVLSKAGYMSLLLPTWQNNYTIPPGLQLPSSSRKRPLPEELQRLEHLTAIFTSRLHWELSTTLTSNHILALVAMSNTLMSMSAASFLADSEKLKKLQRLAQRADSTLSNEEEREELIAHHTSQIKQGWSLLSTHHCFLLPDKIEALEPKKFKRPQVEMMVKRWQHHCIEIREAAQQILLGELTRMGKKGRKQLVESWAQYLPLYTHTEPIVGAQQVAAMINSQAGGSGGSGNANSMGNGSNSMAGGQSMTGGVGGSGTGQAGDSHQDEDYEEEEEEIIRKPSSLSELKRKQTTAVILLGVIGAEFGQDISQESPNHRGSISMGPAASERRKSSVVEGFGIANNLARLTSMALAHLLYAPPSPKLPQYTPLRRAAIDLLGRGFTVWEPYLDVSKVLLGLLEISCEGKAVPNLNYKLPLTPQADACRTARHALRLIATARPAAFITTMAREVARYNTMQQNAQSINTPLTQSVLYKAKSEILQCVEMLIDKMQSEIAGLLVEVMDIALHCVDSNELKSRGLAELCPAICKFNQISHCAQTRRIAVGANSGNLAIYELRQNKCQMIPAHTHPITSLAFSPDGKYLVSYSCTENRLSFWQTSTGMFGLGQSQTRCTKSYSTAPIPDVSRLNPMRLAKLVWINNRTVTLMLADGSETRFNV